MSGGYNGEQRNDNCNGEFSLLLRELNEEHL